MAPDRKVLGMEVPRRVTTLYARMHTYTPQTIGVSRVVGRR